MNLAQKLGATEEGKHLEIEFFVPDKDRQGEVVADWQDWCDRHRDLATRIGDGSTASPTAFEGTYLTRSGETIFENTYRVYTHFHPAKLYEHYSDLEGLLYGFLEMANQECVVFRLYDGSINGLFTIYRDVLGPGH